jgi:hypothetical protein
MGNFRTRSHAHTVMKLVWVCSLSVVNYLHSEQSESPPNSLAPQVQEDYAAWENFALPLKPCAPQAYHTGIPRPIL